MTTGRRTAAVFAVLAAAAATAALGAGAAPPIKAMLWAPADVDPARAFGSVPTECLTPPATPSEALRVEIGRAAFRTPVVLGGQAARAGLSCESCHRQGRGNPDFQFPGVSGPPGTADVTSSLFSTHRGNGADDPRPIPDLSGAREQLRVDQAPAAARLEPFIRGLIVEEFDGPEPAPAILDGLAAYVRALQPSACPAVARQPVRPALLMDDARRALRAADAVANRGDPAAAVTLVAAARARLGLIDERFASPKLVQEHAALRAADLRLAAVQTTLRERPPQAPAAIAAWLSDSAALEAALARRESASLFDPARLATAAAKRRLPG